MDNVIRFFVPMRPKAKQGDRSGIAKTKSGQSFIRHYKDPEVEKAEWWIASNAQPFKPLQPLEGCLFCFIKAFSTIPTSFSNKKRAACISCEVWPTGKPDADNLCKMILDALGTSKQFFKNDSQFVFVVIMKMYSPDKEGIEITMGEMIQLPKELMALANEMTRMIGPKGDFPF